LLSRTERADDVVTQAAGPVEQARPEPGCACREGHERTRGERKRPFVSRWTIQKIVFRTPAFDGTPNREHMYRNARAQALRDVQLATALGEGHAAVEHDVVEAHDGLPAQLEPEEVERTIHSGKQLRHHVRVERGEAGASEYAVRPRRAPTL